MALIDKASLLMVPSTYEAGKLYNVLPSGNRAPDSTDQNSGYDQTRADFDFDRGSNASATRIGSDGLIKKYRENVLTYSNSFNQWSVVSVSLTGGQAGYDGSNDAWLFNSSAGYIRNNLSLSGVYTYSIYAKQGTADGIRLRMDAGTDANVYINLTDGSEFFSNTGIDYTATNVGDGWWRISVTQNDSSFSNFRVYAIDAGGSTTGTIYIQDAQVERSLVPTGYLETTTTTTGKAGVLVDLPRINYDANGENGALLLEPSRANSIIYSEYTDGSNWSNEGSITDEENTSETTSPEGLYNAVKLVSANATSEQWIQTTGVQTTNGTDCTISCFVKKSDYDYFHIRFTGINGAFAAGSVWFNIAEGSVGTKQIGISADIKDYGNGWYRISATKEATATTTAGIRFQLASSNNDYNVVGDGVKGTYIYGAQAEIGSYVSSYIPTMGTSETRAADSCSVTGVSDVMPTAYPFTLYAEMDVKAIGDEWGISFLNDAANNNYFVIGVNFQNKYGMISRPSGSSSFIYSNVNATEGTHKICGVFTSSELKLYVDGTLLGTETNSQSFNSSVDDILIGTLRSVGDTGIRNDVRQAMIFNEALTDAECVTLTTL